MAYALDTHAAIQNLTAAGIEKAHAEAIVATVVQSDETSATKGDIAALRSHLDAVAARLEAKLVASERRTLLAALGIAGLLFAALRFLG